MYNNDRISLHSPLARSPIRRVMQPAVSPIRSPIRSRTPIRHVTPIKNTTPIKGQKYIANVSPALCREEVSYTGYIRNVERKLSTGFINNDRNQPTQKYESTHTSKYDSNLLQKYENMQGKQDSYLFKNEGSNRKQDIPIPPKSDRTLQEVNLFGKLVSKLNSEKKNGKNDQYSNATTAFGEGSARKNKEGKENKENFGKNIKERQETQDCMNFRSYKVKVLQGRLQSDRMQQDLYKCKLTKKESAPASNKKEPQQNSSSKKEAPSGKKDSNLSFTSLLQNQPEQSHSSFSSIHLMLHKLKSMPSAPQHQWQDDVRMSRDHKIKDSMTLTMDPWL